MPIDVAERNGHVPAPIRDVRLAENVEWVVWNARPLRTRKFKVLFVIAAYLDSKIQDPAIRELASRTGMDRNRVAQIVDWLEEQGWIAVERFEERHLRNRYTLLRHKGGTA